MTQQLRRSLLLAAALTCFVPGTGGAAPAGFQTRQVVEPVFGEPVYLMESGRDHPMSIVLVHGVGDLGARIWEGLLPVLAREYHVVAFDLPGFGRSGKGDHLYSPGRYAAFLEWVVEQYVPGPFILAGHSLGGAIALRFAAEYPASGERPLHRLVLIDAAGILHRVALTKFMAQVYPEDTDLLLEKVARWASTSGSDEQERAPTFHERLPEPVSEWLATVTERGVVELKKSLAATMESLDRTGFDDMLGKLLPQPEFRQRILKGRPDVVAGLALVREDFSSVVFNCRVPTLLLWGRADDVAPLRTGRVLDARLAASRLLVIQGAGHSPMLERPATVEALLLPELRAPLQPSRPLPTAAPGRAPLEITATPHQAVEQVGGRFGRITVRGTGRVLLRELVAANLDVAEAQVELENCRIVGDEVGIRLRNARLVATALDVEAVIAVDASESRLDLAGVDLKGVEAAIATPDAATVIFSVSRVSSRGQTRTVHGTWRLSPALPL